MGPKRNPRIYQSVYDWPSSRSTDAIVRPHINSHTGDNFADTSSTPVIAYNTVHRTLVEMDWAQPNIASWFFVPVTKVVQLVG